jgi:hypothetical protein
LVYDLKCIKLLFYLTRSDYEKVDFLHDMYKIYNEQLKKSMFCLISISVLQGYS